jgi:hypothetical protein
MRTLWQDVRSGVRMLRKNPGFTAGGQRGQTHAFHKRGPRLRSDRLFWIVTASGIMKSSRGRVYPLPLIPIVQSDESFRVLRALRGFEEPTIQIAALRLQ